MSRVLAVLKSSKKGQIHSVIFNNIDSLEPLLNKEEDEMLSEQMRLLKFYDSQLRKSSMTVERVFLRDFPFYGLTFNKGNFLDRHFTLIKKTFNGI